MLEVEELRVAYGNIEALHGVNLHVERGELVALIGSNGAGKTTTLLAISGILRPRAGRITFDGTELSRLAPHDIVRMGISHCPEGRLIFGRLTVDENLVLGGYSRRDKRGVREDRDYVYELFPVLAERHHQVAGTLSGGEQQMLAIGRSLMSRPRLLLLDEPSLGLAPLLVQRIFPAIEQLRRDGVTVLLVEQNANQALALGDRAYLLENGTVRRAGPCADLAADPVVQDTYLGG